MIIKYKIKIEMDNATIRNLLSDNISNSKSTISKMDRLKYVMSKYISSPWDAIEKKFLDKQTYADMLKNVKTKAIDTNTLCATKFSNSDPNYIYQQKLCQHHSGDLFQHSQWSALQIIKWNIDGDEVVEDLDMKTAIISAFFHDIGKGGDCIETCIKTMCWFDMYSSKKYNNGHDSIHPTYSGDMILGKIEFKINCDSCVSDCSINIKSLIEETFPDVSIKQVALSAYMHWEFGKLNINDKKSDNDKIINYFINFNTYCKLCDLEPSEYLLRLCIAVSCADITAGTNRRLVGIIEGGIKPADEIYLGKDPWTLYGMDKKYLKYRKNLLEMFDNSQFYSLFM